MGKHCLLFRGMLLLLVAFVGQVQAATYYWIGGVSNTWNTGGNWSMTLGGIGGVTVPGALDNAVFDGSNIGGGATGTVAVSFDNSYTVGGMSVLNFGANSLNFASTSSNNRTLTIQPGLGSNTFTIASNSTLNLNGQPSSNRNFTLSIGNNCTATVDGTITTQMGGTANGVFSATGSGTIAFAATGVYIHNINGGTVPTATWHANSECRVTGMVATVPTLPTTPTYGNLTWNSPAQTAVFSVNASPFLVASTLKITSTGSGAFVLRSNDVASTVTLGALQVDGGTFRAYSTVSSNSRIITVNTTTFSQSSGLVSLNSNSLSASSSASLVVSGDFTQSGGTFDLAPTGSVGNGNLFVGGNFIQSGAAILQRTAGNVASRLELNGASNTLITVTASSLGNNVNVTLNKTGAGNTVTLTNTMILPTNTTLSLSSGILVLGGNTLNLGSVQTIARTGSSSIDNTTGTVVHGTTTHLNYTGGSNFTTGAELPTVAATLGNLTVNLSSANIVTLGADATVNTALNITSGTLQVSGFNLNSPATTTLNTNGTLNDDNVAGTNSLANLVFSGGTLQSTANALYTIGTLATSTANGTIGACSVTVTGTTNVTASRTLTVNSATGTKSFVDVTVNGTWTNSGNAAIGISGTLTVNTGATFTSGSGVYTLSGTSKNIAGSISNFTVTALTVTGSYVQTVTAFTATTLNVSGSYVNNTALTTTNLNILSSGYLNTANALIATTTAISAGGQLDINAGITFTLNGTLTNAGVFKVVGTSGNPALVTRSAANYTITQSAGTFHAQYYNFTNLGTNGITISGGAIDATNNFSNGTFTTNSGTATAYLTLTGLNFADFVVSNVVFGAGATSNVARTSGSGIVTFANATGVLAGYGFENDSPAFGQSTGLVQWTAAAATYYWVGGAAVSNWNATGVWATSLGGAGVGAFSPGNADIFIFDGSNIGAGATGNVTASVNANYSVASIRILNFTGGNQVTLQANNAAAANLTLTVAPATADVFTLAAGNILNVTGNASTRNLTLNIGNNAIATIDGTLNIGINSGVGALTVSGSGSIAFGNTAVYIHAVNGGAIPTASWANSSECRITGTVATAPTFATTPTFGNLTWNAPAQTVVAPLNVSPLTVASVFKIVTTNSGSVVLRSTNAASTFTVGTFQVDGGTFTAYNAANANTITLTANQYTQSAGTVNLNASANAGAAVNFTVNDNFTQTGGIFDLAATGVTGTGTLFLSGNFSQSGSAVLRKTAGIAPSRLELNGAASTFTTVAGGLGTGLSITLNKTTASTAVQLLSAVSLPAATRFTLTSGVWDLNANTLTYGAGVILTRSAGALNTNGGAYAYSGTIDVVYTGNQDITTGAEVPTPSNALNNFTASVGASNTVNLNSNALVNGNLNVTTGTLALGSNTANRVASGGTLSVSGGAFLLIGGTGTFPTNYTTNTLAATSTVNYNGGNQTVRGALTYGNLTISGTGTKTLDANVTGLAGNVNVAAGTFDLVTFTANRTANTTTFTVASGALLKIGGTSTTFPSGYTTYVLTGSTVEYYGTTQTVAQVAYHHVTVSGSATNSTNAVTIAGDVLVTGTGNYNLGTGGVTHTIGGTLTVSGTLAYGASGNQVLTVTGNLIGAGALNMNFTGTKTLNLGGADNSGYIGTFTAGSGTVSYTRTGNQLLFAGAYNTLTFTNTGNRTILGTTTVAQNFTVPSGITLLLNGFNFTASGTLAATGTVTVPAGSTLTSTGVLTVGGLLTVSGTGSVLTASANVNVNAAATLSIGANAVFNMNGATLANNGTFSVVGTSGNVATVTRSVAGNYVINQTGAGAATAVFAAKYYVFNATGTNGISISAGSIDAVNNLSDGTFQNGAGTAYLTLSALNFSSFTASNVVFEGASAPTYNVSRNSGTGTITIQDYSGARSGQAFEFDLGVPGTLINWSISGTAFYSQAVGNFYALSTWNSARDGSGVAPSSLARLTDGSNDFVIQGSHVITLNNNVSVKALKVETNGALVLGDASTIARTLSVGGNLEVQTSASVVVANFNAVHTFNFLGDNFINNGTFNLFNTSILKSANFNFNGVTMALSGSNAPVFASVSFNNQAPPYTNSVVTTSVPLVIKGNVVFVAGAIWNDGGLVHTVAGNWQQATPTQLAGTGTIKFNGSGTQQITNAATFNNLTFEGGNAPSINGAITVGGKMYITSSTNVSTATGPHNYNGDFVVDALSSYNQTANSATFGSATTQNIDFSNATFNALTFSGAGLKATTANLRAIGGVTINAGTTVDGAGAHTITGNFVVNGTSAWTGLVTLTGGNLSSVNASLALAGPLAIAGNVTLVNTVAANPLTLAINGDFNLLSGTFTINSPALVTGTTGFALNVANGAAITMLGANNFPTGFDAYNFVPGATANYTATTAQSATQTIAPDIAYANLTIQNNTKSAGGNISVLGNLTYTNTGTVNTTLDLLGKTLSVAGNIAVGNTGSALSSTLPGGTLLVNAANANQTIGVATYTLDNIIVTQASPSAPRTKTFSNGSNITVLNFEAQNPTGDASNRLIVDLNSNVVSAAAGASTFKLQPNAGLYIAGVSNLQTTFDGFATIAMHDSSFVRYNSGTQNQNIASKTGVSYGTIELSGSTNKTANSALDINGSLVISGNTPVFIDGGFNHTLAGNWSLTVNNYNRNLGSSGTITMDGLNQNIVGNVINVVFANGGTKTITTTHLTVQRNLTINSGVLLDANIRNITIEGDWLQLGTGALVQSGTTTFSGISSAPQTITIAKPWDSHFGNLTVNRGDALGNPSSNIRVVTNSSLRIDGALRLNNYTDNPTCSILIPYSNLDISDDTLSVGGHFVLYPAALMTTTNSTLLLQSETAQNFYMGNASVVFNNITFSGGGLKYFINGGNNNGCGNWNNPVVLNGNWKSDLATVNGNATAITVNGNWYNTGDFQHGNTVTLLGAGKTITNSTFYSLNLGATASYTLLGDITVSNNFTVSTGAGLDVSASNYSITVSGNYVADGTVNYRNNTVYISSGGNNLSSGKNLGNKFYNLEITNTSCGATTTLTDSLFVNNNLTINAGRVNTGNFSVSVGNNFFNYDQYNQNSATARLTFEPIATGTRSFVSTVPAACGTSTYGNTVVNIGTAKLVQSGAVQISANTLRLQSGIYKMNGNVLDFTNSAASLLNILSSATLEVDSGATLLVRNTVSNQGVFKLVGTTAAPATLGSCTACGTANYTVLQNGASAVFHAKNYLVQSSGTATNNYLLDLQAGTLDATNNFSNGTFSSTTTGGTTSAYVRFGNTFLTSNVVANGVTFNSGKPRNVELTANPVAFTISFQNSSGSLAGAIYETDVPANGATTGNIRWTFSPTVKFWDGNGSAANTSWNTANNWFPDGVPTASDTVYIDNSQLNASYTINIDVTDTASVAKLIMQRVGANTITLNVLAKNLKTATDISIASGCTVNGGTGSIIVGSSWSNGGTFTQGTSMVVFKGGNSSYNISNGTSSFYNLALSGVSGAKYLLGSQLTANTITIDLNNTLDVSTGAYNVTVGGDWINNGIFNPRSGSASIITFNRSGAQAISKGPFNNIVTAGTGTKTLGNNVTIYRSVTIGTGTVLDAAANSIYVGLNWINNATGGFTQAADQFVYFNGAGQNIDNGTQASTFSNVALIGTGTKTLGRNSAVNGEFLIAPSGLVFNMQDYQLVGNGTTSQFNISSNSTVLVGGTASFLNNFATTNLAVNSTIRYQPMSVTYDGAVQTIMTLPNGSAYGNLDLRVRANITSTTVKSIANDILIAGNLSINDIYTQLLVNSKTITLTGDFNFPTGGTATNLVWGANGALIHNGTASYTWQNSWSIDADIPVFNNLILAGSQRKTMNGNLSITGNLTIQGNVTLDMNTFTVVGTASHFMLMQNASRLESAVASPALAFPTGFSTYNIDPGSNTYLDADGAQDVFTTPNYGNLTFATTNTSTPLRTITLIGGALRVVNDLNFTNTTFVDNNLDLFVGGNLYTNDFYVPSTVSRLTLEGDNQVVQNQLNNATVVNFNHLTVTGTGVKTLGNANVTVNIKNDLYIDTALTLTTVRPLIYSGTNWNNQGVFSNSNTTTFDNAVPAQKVRVNPGATAVGNSFGIVNFNTADTLLFIGNGGDFNGAFNINSGVVDMGNGLTHTIAGLISVYSTSPNPWYSNRSNLVFDGGNQSIPVALIAKNVVCANAGTKTMVYTWSVEDLTINNGVTLTNLSNDNLYVAGHFVNNGTYNANNTVLVMNANTGTKNIQVGGSTLYDLSLVPTGTVTYKLTSPTTRVTHAIEVKNAATLKLNGKTLIHGNTGIISGKVLTVASTATLHVDVGASLLFDNRSSIAAVTIDGLLKLQGTADSIATISRSNTGGQSILINGNIDASHYLLEYMSTSGLQLSATANIFGLSDGTFSNLNASNGSAYVTSNIISTPASITNVVFNYTGTPVVGNQYNVKQFGASTITFVAPISGVLSCPTYKLGNVVMPNCSVVSWIGVTDSDWNKGTNWSTGVVPDSTIDVIIPIPTVPNQGNLPVINITNAVCRNLTLTNGSLSLATGGLLDVHGDVLIGSTASATLALSDQTNTIRVKGNWTKATGSFNFGPLASPGIVEFYSNGSVNINNGTLSFGSVVFSGSGFYNLVNGYTINSTGNSFSVKGNLTQHSGTIVPTTGTLFVEGNFTRVAGNYSAVGTVNFTGSAAQTITDAQLNNVVFSAPNIRNASGNISIAGTTSMTNGSLVAQPASVITFGGNVTFAVGTTFDVNNSTHSFRGATWTGSGNSVGNGFVSFDAGNQNLAASNMVGVAFAGTGTKTLTGNVNMIGDLFIRPNITVDLQTFVINNASGTSLFDLAGGTTVNVSGANNFPAGFVAYTLACNSLVNYNSSVLTQTVFPVSYGNLTVTGGYPSFWKNLGGNLDICGNLNIAVNTTLDVTTNNYNIVIGGNFNNNNNNGSFRARLGSVTFNGAGNQNINLGTSGITGTKDFYGFIVDKPAGTATFASSNTVNIKEDVLVSRGTLSLVGPDTVVVGGNFQAILGGFTNGYSRVFLKATNVGDYLIRTNGSALYDVIINSPGSTYDLVDNALLYRNLDIKANSTLDVAGLTLTLGDDNVRTANISGALKIGAGGKLALANIYTVNVQPSGLFELLGVSGNIATVTSTVPGSRYNFNVDGAIAANNYLFEYMRSSGISLSSTSVIAARPNNFSEGTFANGTSGGVFLKIENTQFSAPAGSIDTIMNVNFNTNPGGGARNVAKTLSATGRLIFHNASGSFAGSAFENDPFNLIDWTGNYTLNWTGAVNTNWYDPLNWSPNIVPTLSDNAVIQITTNQPVIDNAKPGAAAAVCKNLTIILGASVTLKSTDAVKDLVVANDITINGILKLTNNQDTLTVGGNWLRGVSGSVIPGNGSVVLVAPSGVKIVNNRTSLFGNLIINGAANFQLGSSTSISKSLVINTGTLDVTNTNNYNLTVGADWINRGQFLGRNGTVTLNGQCASTYTIKSGLNSAFNNLTISPCSSTVYNLSVDPIAINGTYTLNGGTFNLNALTFNMGNATGSEVLNVYGVFNMNANSSVLMAAGASINVQSAGHFKMIGVDSINTANVGLQSTGNYGFIVNSGGTISGNFYTVNGLNTTGLLIRSGATITSGANNLSNGVYSGGGQSGYFITMEHSFSAPVVMGVQQCDTIKKVTFSTGASKNVLRITGTGCVTFKDSKGPLSGYLYEKDELAPNSIAGRLRWAYSNPTLNWTGAAQDGDWFNPLNWKDGSGGASYYPDATTIVVIDNAAIVNPKTYPTIKSSANAACPSGICPTTATALDVNLAKQTFLTLSQNRNLNVGRNMTVTGGTFIVSPGSNSTVDVGLTLSVENSAAITGAFSAGNATINVYKDFKAGGFFRGQSSTLKMMAPSGTATIYSTGANSYFSKLYFLGAATFQQSSSNTGNLKVRDSLAIGTGATLLNTSSANSMTLAGSWTNNGTFTPGTGLVSFDTAAAARVQYIGGTTTTIFNILNMNGNSEKRLMNHIQINGTCTIGGVSYAIFNMNGKNIAMNGSAFTVSNVSSQLRHGGAGTVTFATTGTQTISISGVGTNRAFYHVAKTGSGVLRLGSNVDIDGNLTINAGSFSATTRTLYLGGNWVNNGTFVPGSSSIRFDGTNQNITNSAVETFHNLVAAGSRLTLTNNNVKVNNALNIGTGIIVSGTYTLELTSPTTSSTITAGSYVDGYFLKNFNSTASKVMEVGAKGVYSPITITPTTASAGYFRVRAAFYDAPTLSSSCLDTALTVNRYWDVTKTIGNFNATFTYSPAITNAGVVPANLALYNYSGGIWNTINTVVPSPTATSLTANNISQSGYFQIASPRISSVTITSSVVGTACSGSPFVFTAHPVNAGSTPSYQWKLNNGNVGTNAPTYSVTGLLAGDMVNLVMTDICGANRNSNDLTITIGTSNTWSGATSTDWFTGSNWSCGIVPNNTLDVTIPSPVSNYPQINASASVKDIQVNTGAGLTLLPTGTLNVSGNWTNNGLLVPQDGSTVRFDANTGTQNIGGSAKQYFYNLQKNNAGALRLTTTSSVEIRRGGVVKINAGVFNMDGKKLVLKSKVSAAPNYVDSTASLAPVLGSITNASNFTIERYNSAIRGTRYIGAPVSGVTFARFKDSIVIAGPAAGGFDSPYSSVATAKDFLETRNYILSKGFVSIASVNTPVTPGKGYYLFVPAKRTTVFPANEPVTLLMKGTPVVGNFNFSLTYTPTASQGWNLLANPYPSAIDWDQFRSSGTNLDGAIYIWDPHMGTSGGYYTYVGGIASDARANGSIISSSQGFFVKATAASPTLSITESAKVGSSFAKSNFRQAAANYITFKISNQNGDIDYTTVRINDGSSNQTALKMENSKINLYTLSSSGVKQAINTVVDADFELPLYLQSTTATSYTIEVVKISGDINAQNTLKLRDEATGELIALTEGFSHTFAPDGRANKYTLLRTSAGTVITSSIDALLGNATLHVYPNPSHGYFTIVGNGESSLTVNNELGVVVAHVKLNAVNGYKASLNHLAPGVYTLHDSKGMVASQKIVIVK